MPANRLVGGQGTGRRPRTYTPAASEAGDMPAGSGSSSKPPQTDLPPSYAESVDLGSDSHLEAGPPVQGDNKIQHDDDLLGEESSDLDDDDSDITLDDLTLDDLVAEDEAAWALDEYAASHAPPSYEDATTVVSEDDLVREIIAAQHAQSSQSTHGRLPCPVIIPQRRPRNRSRGFVRAYAPVLQNVGIDQDTFLRFLTNFHKSSQASPWFTVIEVSSKAAHAAGPAIGFAVEAAVKSAVTNRRHPEVAHETNNFLDRMNHELFKPAGTFAFLMKYKTDTSMPDGGDGFFGVVAANINLSTNQVEPQKDGVSGLVNQMSMFRIASGATQGADDMPESAPLIFPEIDKEAARIGDQKSKAGELNSFVQEYLDRRLGTNFSREDSKSSVASPQEQLDSKSKVADSESSMWNTGVVGLLTGGYLNLMSLASQRQQARQDRRADRHERRQERREDRHERRAVRHQRIADRHVRRLDRRHGKAPSASASTPTSERNIKLDDEAEQPSRQRDHRRRRRHGRPGRNHGTVGKVMNEDVVYLMVVNLPSETELSATMEAA